MTKQTYAIYRGDEFIGVGTAEELAKIHGVKPETIQWLASSSARKRGMRTLAYKVGDER